jgi:hypothetical protein
MTLVSTCGCAVALFRLGVRKRAPGSRDKDDVGLSKQINFWSARHKGNALARPATCAVAEGVVSTAAEEHGRLHGAL